MNTISWLSRGKIWTRYIRLWHSRMCAAFTLVVAPLGEVEWPGTIKHIRATLPDGVPLILAPIASGKTPLNRVEERGKWPDPARRSCTGHYKRTSIERELRRYLKAHPRFGGRIVSAMGIRIWSWRPRVRIASKTRPSGGSLTSG